MKYILLIGFSICVLYSCSDPDATLRKELDTAVFKIDMLEQQLKSKASAQSGDLVHIVYFNTKDDLNQKQQSTLIEDLNQLQGIQHIKSFALGHFKNLNDTRALSEYEIIMSMSFQDQESYQKYQDHPTHIALKGKLENYLAGPPATYDYTLR